MSYYRGKWAGRVYDGPLEGEHHVKESPYFDFQWSPDVMPMTYLSNEIPAMAYCYRLTYRWSNPLRCWVFDWRSAPQPKAPARKKPDPYARNIRYEKRCKGGDWAV
jgi:hypothetical protein